MNAPDPIICTLFLVSTFVISGIAQTLWLRSRLSQRLAIPLDAGRSLRGRRILGDNKTWRGFVVMVPTVGVAFMLVHMAVQLCVGRDGGDALWPLSTWQYGLLGCWVGFGFMFAELPNSFMKRQLGIHPGMAPENARAKSFSFIIDRLDSVVGGLLALALVVPLPLLTWLLILLVGPIFHWSFSFLLFQFGVKARPA